MTIARSMYWSLSVALLLLVSCSNKPDARRETRDETAQIPQLKPRPTGLAPEEFAAVRKKDSLLRIAITAQPDEPEGYVKLAQVFMHEARVTGDHPYYYPAAVTLLDEALRHDSVNLPALISKGSVLLSLHHFDEALKVGERARALAPHLAVVYGILCDAQIELGRYDAAVVASDSMNAIRPDLGSYSRASYLREIHGEDKGAIEAMTMAVKAGPAGAEETEWARFTLGNLYMQQGDLVNAEKQFLTSLAVRPGFPFALSGLARVRSAQGKQNEALTLLDSALSFIPEFSFVEYQADIYRAMGDSTRADSLIRIVETMLAEDEAAGHYADKEFALLYANHNIKPDEAVARARKELARRPDNIEAQHAMAWTLYRQGKAAEAKEFIDKALRLNTNNPTMIAHAGLIEQALGNTAAARMMLKRATALNPHLPALLMAEAKRAMA